MSSGPMPRGASARFALVLLAATGAWCDDGDRSICQVDGDVACRGVEVDCCATSSMEDEVWCKHNGNGSAGAWMTCDVGTTDRKFEVMRGDYTDELENAGTMEPLWNVTGHDNARSFEGGFAQTHRMYTLISRTNSEWFFRSYALDSDVSKWSDGLSVWIFARFSEPPELAYSIEDSYVDGNVTHANRTRLVLSEGETKADYMVALGGPNSRIWVTDSLQNGTAPRVITAGQWTENFDIFGRNPLDGDPTKDTTVWLAWLVAGETFRDDSGEAVGRAEWKTAVEIHDPVAFSIYVSGASVLLLFAAGILVLVVKYPKKWLKLVAFFWDRGAPPVPEDDGLEFEEDSCDEDDLLLKSPEELELEQLKREQAEKEEEARKLRQGEIKAGDRDSIAHSDEEGAEEFAAEMDGDEWTPMMLFEKVQDYMTSIGNIKSGAQDLSQYPGDQGMRDTLLGHCKVLADKLKFISEVRGKKHAPVKRTPSRKTRTLNQQDVVVSPELQEVQDKARELEELVADNIQKKKQLLMDMKSAASEKMPGFLAKLPPRPKFLGGKSKPDEDEDEDAEGLLLLGAVAEVPFEKCVTDLKGEVLPHFTELATILKELPTDQALATVNVAEVVTKMRDVAGKVEKSILQHVPTFCTTLQREVQSLKEARGALDLRATFDEEQMQPLTDLENLVNDARETQAKIIQAIKVIQRLARIKSARFYRARGRKLLRDDDAADEINVSSTPGSSACAADADKDKDAPEQVDNPLQRELEAAEAVLQEQKSSQQAAEAALAEDVRRAEEEAQRAAEAEEAELQRQAAADEEANAKDAAKADASPDELQRTLEAEFQEKQAALDAAALAEQAQYESEMQTAGAASREAEAAAAAEAERAEEAAQKEREAMDGEMKARQQEADQELARQEAEAAAALQSAEEEAPKEEKAGGRFGNMAGGLKGKLDAKLGDRIAAMKEGVEKKKQEAKDRLQSEQRALEAKHADKLAKVETMKQEAKQRAEAKQQELLAQHAEKIAAAQAKKAAVAARVEEAKRKAQEELETMKRDLDKALAAAKDAAERARNDRAALLAEMRAKADAKKTEFAAAVARKAEEANQKRKQLQDALGDRERLVADLRARLAAGAQALRAGADEAMLKAMSLKNKLTGHGNADAAKKDLEVFIYNLKKVSLSSIRPALAGAIADVKGMRSEAYSNRELFQHEEADIEEVKDEFNQGMQGMNIGMLQGLLKSILQKLKRLIGKGSSTDSISNKDAEEVIKQLDEAKDMLSSMSGDMKTKVVDAVTRLRSCVDGDVPELGTLAGAIGNIKAMITRGHTLGKVAGSNYKKMDGIINFEATSSFVEINQDVKSRAAAEIRQFTADDPPEVRDAAFVFKCSERQMHWEKQLSRDVLLLTDKIARVVEEGSQFDSQGEKKAKKSLWDPCMIKHSTHINGPDELVSAVLNSPGFIPNAAAAFLRSMEEMCDEFKGFLLVAWADVAACGKKLAAAGPDKAREAAKKAFVHAAQRVEAALAAAAELIDAALAGLADAGFPVQTDYKAHIFAIAKEVTRELNAAVQRGLGIDPRTRSFGQLADSWRDKAASTAVTVLKPEGAGEQEMDNKAPRDPEPDVEAQRLQPAAEAFGGGGGGVDEKQKKRLKKKDRFANAFAMEGYAAVGAIAMSHIANMAEGISGNKKSGHTPEKLLELRSEAIAVTTTIESLVVRAQSAAALYDRKQTMADVLFRIHRLADMTLVRKHECVLEDLTDDEKPLSLYLQAGKELSGDGEKSIKACAEAAAADLNSCFVKFLKAVQLVSANSPGVDVLFMGAHHMNVVDAVCFCMELKAALARSSVGLDMALRARKEKAGLPDLRMWKERDSAQAREYINHLREEFLNSPLGQGLLKAKELVGAAAGAAVQKLGAFMDAVGATDKVNEAIADVKQKAEQVRAVAMREFDAMKERTLAKINDTPALKQRFDVIKLRAAAFGDGEYDEETAKLRAAIDEHSTALISDTLQTCIDAVNPAIRQAMEATQLGQGFDEKSTPRDTMLYTYCYGLHEFLDTDAAVFLEMEACVAEWTGVVEHHATQAENKIRDARARSHAKRSLADFELACHKGAVSVRDVASVCLELLQDFWSDSTARDSRGKRRSTMADDDVALGLDAEEDPRVLWMKTRMLRRVSCACHEFYRVLKRGCTRLQKLVLATKNVEKTFFFHKRTLRLELQVLVGDAVYSMQQKQTKEWNTASVYTLNSQVEGALTATKERASAYQCAPDGQRVLNVSNIEEKEAGIIGHVVSGVAGTEAASPHLAKIMMKVQAFSLSVALVVKNQAVMAFQLAQLRDISVSIRPQILSFDPLPPLQKLVAGLKSIDLPGVALVPDPAIAPLPCSWPVYFKGMIGGFSASAQRMEGKSLNLKGRELKLGHVHIPTVPIDPAALPIPPLWDKAALLVFRLSLYLGIVLERAVALLVEAVKIFFNIVMMTQALASMEFGEYLPDFADVKFSMKDNEFFLFLSEMAQVFKDLFSVSSPFEGLDSWNCGGAIKALTPVFLLFGFFVVVLVLKKDMLLTLSVGILRLKIEAPNARKWLVSRLSKLFAILCLYAVQFVVVSSVGLLFGDVLQSTRSCNDFDRRMQLSGFGLLWVGVWTLSLLYLSFFVFVGEPKDPPLWMRCGNREGESWDGYQKRHPIAAAVLFFPWSIVSGCVRLVKQTLGYWDQDVVDAHRIVSRADAYDDDPNDDDNRHELLITLLGKANAIFWLFIPGVGPIFAKAQEAMNESVVFDVDTRVNDLGLNILTPRRSRFFRWAGSAAKYASSVSVVMAAKQWAAQFVAISLASDFVLNLFEDVMSANEIITQMTTVPQ